MDPADFASLLAREPQPGPQQETHEVCRETHDAACAAFERIKSLEGVLVAIRVKAAHPMSYYEQQRKALNEIAQLVTETIDPCKPWCVRDEPGHPGACEPVEDERDA